MGSPRNFGNGFGEFCVGIFVVSTYAGGHIGTVHTEINTKPITSRSKLTYWAVLDDFMEEAIAARKKGVVIAVCLRVRSRVLTYLLLSIT